MADEARAMLDALMGGDRNAPLPQGASTSNGSDMRGGPRRTKRSCYDRDICPLYCAWGVDVYELFRNTKSDTLVGINPNIVDDAAHEEFKALPKNEQERLGYHGMLFHKLQELVQKCDRTVNRNKEKLRQENAKQMQKRGGQDFVEHVDDSAVTQLASAMVRFEFLEKDLLELTGKLQEVQETENDLQSNLVELLKKKQGENNANKEDKKSNTDKDANKGEEAPKDEEMKESSESKEEETTKEQPEPQDSDKKEEITKGSDAQDKETGSGDDNEKKLELEQSLEKTRLEKQRLLVDLKNKASQYQPLEESIQNQRRHLEYVKSDITSDKTVCEVSGNFMSARDADERIAAHYAGKQYVGWKLVRDKFKDMVKEHGRYGPPGGGSGRPPPPPRGGYDYGYGGGRGRHHNDRSRDRGRRSPSPPYWERGGPRGYERGNSGGDWRRDRGGGGRRDSHRHRR